MPSRCQPNLTNVLFEFRTAPVRSDPVPGVYIGYSGFLRYRFFVRGASFRITVHQKRSRPHFTLLLFLRAMVLHMQMYGSEGLQL